MSYLFIARFISYSVARTLQNCQQVMLDLPKVLHFWRITHWCINIFEKSEAVYSLQTQPKKVHFY